ncbi:MAG: tetratricopeptide repeat protein [Alphaproteobacteria bacterium]
MGKNTSFSRRRPITVGPLAPLALTLFLAGCSAASQVDNGITGAIAKPVTVADFETAVDAWAGRYDRDPSNREAALGYARSLRQTGRTDQAVSVLQKAAIRYPDDREVLAAYGKALAAGGDLGRALDAIQRAQTPDQPDWRLLSAEAAILDQSGRHGDARTRYKQAMDLAPNEPSILSNLGMSYILTRELEAAEKVLRRAAAMDGADSRIRQNLALAVGLLGRFEEAEKIATAELPPDEAEANIAYLRRMMSERDDWERLADG